MTAEMISHLSTGAVSRENAGDLDPIDWQAAHENVRRLQARIVKATQAGRVPFGRRARSKPCQRLLTHSFSGKAIAVKRVTENRGKDTPGVDAVRWNTPDTKMAAVHSLKRRGYQPQPLRRVHIPKKNGKTRPLGIPTMKDRAMQALYLLALDPVAENHGRPVFLWIPARTVVRRRHPALLCRAGAEGLRRMDTRCGHQVMLRPDQP